MLRRPLEAVRDRILGDLHRAGFTDTVCAHGTVLRYPGPDGRHPSELAEAAGVTRQAMNYTLGELEALGYTVRVPDPADGRAKLVMTTPRGTAAAQCVRATVIRLEEELSAQLGEEAFARLRELIVRLNGCDFTGQVGRAERREGAGLSMAGAVR